VLRHGAADPPAGWFGTFLSVAEFELIVWCHVRHGVLGVQSLQAEKRARQKAKDKEHREPLPAAEGSSSAAAAATGMGSSFDDELAAAMAEAAAISSR